MDLRSWLEGRSVMPTFHKKEFPPEKILECCLVVFQSHCALISWRATFQVNYCHWCKSIHYTTPISSPITTHYDHWGRLLGEWNVRELQDSVIPLFVPWSYCGVRQFSKLTHPKLDKAINLNDCRRSSSNCIKILNFLSISYGYFTKWMPTYENGLFRCISTYLSVVFL